MRHFTDLHLRFSRGDLKELEEMLRFSSELGYSTLAVSFSHNMKEEIKKARTICSDLGVDLVTRVDLEPKTGGELLEAVKGLRYRFEIIAVKCLTKNVARQAAKDRRVDILDFPTDPAHREKMHFDRQEAVLASGALSALEINASTILGEEPSRRARLLTTVRKEIAEAQRMGVPFILSSGAENLYGLRPPRDLASLLTLMDVNWESALDAVSGEPLKIVERNREKLKAEYISPGVRVVEEHQK
jgi:ribonuclease P/MRP protein subunit RPP1